jgi:hypothetical protein
MTRLPRVTVLLPNQGKLGVKLFPLCITLRDSLAYKLVTLALAEACRASYLDGLRKFALGDQPVAVGFGFDAGNLSGLFAIYETVFGHCGVSIQSSHPEREPHEIQTST